MALPIPAHLYARVTALYRQGRDVQAIAQIAQAAPETVWEIVEETAKRSRVVYIFADREIPATVIDVCNFTQKVEIVNLTDELLSRAFGVKEEPGWEDYEAFLESRCMPRTRYGVREELKTLGIDFYDPFLIVQKTRGRVYEDHQYLSLMGAEWVEGYDEIMKNTKDDSERTEKLRGYLQESEGEWKLDEGCY